LRSPLTGLYRSPEGWNDGVLRKLLLGLSSRCYQECCLSIPEAFGLSPSGAVSRRFIRASSLGPKELMERPLDGFDIVALFIDGKTFREDEMIMAVGVTVDGKKVILSFILYSSYDNNNANDRQSQTTCEGGARERR
jgi:hypothetical protein